MEKGAVLDFDGVLVKSMELHAKAYRDVMGSLGIDVTPAMVFAREGGRSESLIRDFLKNADRPADEALVRDLSARKQERYRALGPAKVYVGAEDLVRVVRRAAGRLALVTGTRRENVDRLIPHLVQDFDAILAQEDYTYDKPHPEPYERAANAIGLPPSACIALENAPRGVESARRAGFGYIVGLTTTVTANQLHAAGAAVVASTHEEAAQRLATWLRTPVERQNQSTI